MANKKGFFVSLGLEVDKNSFDTGHKAIIGVTSQITNLVSAARNASVVLGVMAAKEGSLYSQETKTSVAMNTTVENLNKWKAAAKIAELSADSLMGSMQDLAGVLNHMRLDGSGLEEYSKKLGMIDSSIDINALLDPNLDTSTVYQRILEAAQKAYTEAADDQQKRNVLTAVGDLLGDSGQGFFIELIRTGQTVSQALDEASQTQIVTNEEADAVTDFNRQKNKLDVQFDAISAKIGVEFSKSMIEPLTALNNIIQKHMPDISKFIEAIGSNLATLMVSFMDLCSVLEPYIKEAAKAAGHSINSALDLASKDVDQISGGINQIKNGNVGEGFKTIFFGADFDEKLEDYAKAHGKDAGFIERVNVAARSLPLTKMLFQAGDSIGYQMGLINAEEADALAAISGNYAFAYANGDKTLTEWEREQFVKQVEKDIGQKILTKEEKDKKAADYNKNLSSQEREQERQTAGEISEKAKTGNLRVEDITGNGQYAEFLKTANENYTFNVQNLLGDDLYTEWVMNAYEMPQFENPGTKNGLASPIVTPQDKYPKAKIQEENPEAPEMSEVPEVQNQDNTSGFKHKASSFGKKNAITGNEEAGSKKQNGITGQNDENSEIENAITGDEKQQAEPQKGKTEKKGFWGKVKDFFTYEKPELQEEEVEGKIKGKVQDGIIAPGGHVTQVAPDDWVIAARDLGQVARAFVPHSYTPATGADQYVINQTFNISGSNDIPQILKQQAYKGTQEGLQQIIAASGRRLQLMSGTL